MPLYNEGGRARRLLSHLRGLRGLAEAVVVDASDAAGSRAVVAELAAGLEMESGENHGMPIRFLRLDAPGRAAQMNAGAAACGGTVLLFLHCDTRLPGAAAKRIRDAVNRGHKWGWFDLRLDARGPAYRILERMICLRARASGIATGDMALFVTRRAFLAAGGFAEIPLMEDVELSRRLKRLSRPAVINDPALTSARRWRQNGLARTVFLMWKLRFLHWRGRDPARLAAVYDNVRDAN
ncbi:MAG: TIGR04283 family arsenosugar biosynthesis glycosyltransferase [Gammaproteobacteria bacterium]|nr:TIGR04283 family arsenosugar biosynthesis glycosyltransferase [Gammaproteobacteria bacterium]